MVLPSLVGVLPLVYFAPCLVLSFYYLSLNGSIWCGISTGLLVDLFSSHSGLGLHAFTYALCVFLLYPLKFHLFKEKFSTLPLLTFCFSLILNLLQILFYFITTPLSLSLSFFLEEWIVFPFLNFLYALLFFKIPIEIRKIFKNEQFRYKRRGNRR